MQNFEFYNPTRIVFWTETIARLADLVPVDARVLVLFGGNSARNNGTLAEVTTALGARHVQEFGGIEPNPSYETLMEAVELIRQDKHAKLLQYAERVWQISSGDETQRVDEAIRRTVQFFESLGIKTHLADYDLGADDIAPLVAQLDAHGMTALGGHQNIDLDTSRRILEGAL